MSDCKCLNPEDGEQSGGEYRVGTDENGVEHYDLLLHAVHSYIKLSGAGDAGEDEDAQALNGIYVMSNDGFIPEYYQMKGPGRISFNPDEGMWTIWSRDFGKIQYFYEIYAEVLDVPVEGWECIAQWDPEISPPPTITKHELQVGQDVKLRKHHPDNHIPAEKLTLQLLPLRYFSLLFSEQELFHSQNDHYKIYKNLYYTYYTSHVHCMSLLFL